MKIDSSMIGMESARSYTSVTKKTASATLAGTAAYQGNDWNNGSFSDLLHAGTNEGNQWGNTGTSAQEEQTLSDALQENSLLSRTQNTRNNVTSLEEKRTMQTVRQMCVLYLIRWLYANRNEQGSSLNGESMLSNLGASGYLSSNNSAAGESAASRQSLIMDTKLSSYYCETEQTGYQTTGVVRTSDGREISFGLELTMSRSFEEYYETHSVSEMLQMTDPLVINLDTDMTTLSDQKFEFDLDADGVKDSISMLGSGSGYLALDKNNDGVINDGTELFGTKSGDGFADLSEYDEDGNGWIDENDEIFDKLLIWAKDETGKDELYTLKQAGVGAICLQKAETNFSLNSLKNNQTNGVIRQTGIFLYENGSVGTMQQIDLAQ